MVGAADPAQSAGGAGGDEYPAEILADSNGGGKFDLNARRGRVATVLVCMSVECPVSNEFVPTLNRLAESTRAQGVNFIGVNPNSDQSLAEMADYARERKLPFPFVKDEGGKVSRRLRFSVTPEVAVFDAAGKLAYRGRIDDRYNARSRTPNGAVTADLENALAEIQAGKPVAVARTKAIGCPIQ